MSLHLTDINFALDRGHVSTIKDAFRALVGWPHEDTIEGADGAQRQSLLVRVCEALKDDDRQMPGGTITILEDGALDLYGGNYRHGARAVLSDLPYWRKKVGGDA